MIVNNFTNINTPNNYYLSPNNYYLSSQIIQHKKHYKQMYFGQAHNCGVAKPVMHNKTNSHDITEISLKVVLTTHTHTTYIKWMPTVMNQWMVTLLGSHTISSEVVPTTSSYPILTMNLQSFCKSLNNIFIFIIYFFIYYYVIKCVKIVLHMVCVYCYK